MTNRLPDVALLFVPAARLDPEVAAAEDRVLAGLDDHDRHERRRLLVGAFRR